MEERRIDVGKVRLHVVIEAPPKDLDGAARVRPPVVLLHGFPEFWYSWRKQLPALAAAGFRAIAPDLRGCNLSDKPPGVARYRLPELAADVAGLIRALGGRAFLVGHDWGGAIAWYLAMRSPELLERLAVLNCPHPRLLARRLLTASQLRRSWYMFFYQLPWLPERMLLSPDFAVRALRGTAARRDAFSDEDLARFSEAWRRPGAATATINYYRAMFRPPVWEAFSRRPVRVPTLVVWGERDRFLGSELLDGLPALVPDLRLRRLPQAGHWVQQECPDEVNAELVAFFEAAATPVVARRDP